MESRRELAPARLRDTHRAQRIGHERGDESEVTPRGAIAREGGERLERRRELGSHDLAAIELVRVEGADDAQRRGGGGGSEVGIAARSQLGEGAESPLGSPHERRASHGGEAHGHRPIGPEPREDRAITEAGDEAPELEGLGIDDGGEGIVAALLGKKGASHEHDHRRAQDDSPRHTTHGHDGA